MGDVCNRLVDTELRDTLVKAKANPDMVEPRWWEGWVGPPVKTCTETREPRVDIPPTGSVRPPVVASNNGSMATNGAIEISALTGQKWQLDTPDGARGLELRKSAANATGIALSDVTLIRRTDKTKVNDADTILMGKEHRFHLMKTVPWRVLYPFNGPEYGSDYLVLSQGDVIERLVEESGWAQGRFLLRASGEVVPESAATIGWYPTDYAETL